MSVLDLKGDWKEFALWTGGGLAALLLAFLATFPYEALNARILGEARRLTGMEVRAADWTIGFPLGLEWRRLTFSPPQGDPMDLAVLEARVGLLKALTGGAGLDLVARQGEDGSQGTAKGTVTAASWSFAGPVAVKGRVQQVDLSKILHRYVRQGLLSGEFSHRLESPEAAAGQIKGEGTWNATVKDLTVDQIQVGGGRTLSLAFTTVSLAASCHDAVCTVTEFRGEGLDGTLTAEGTITLQQPVRQSQLALNVTVVPGPGFASKATALGLPPLPAGAPIMLKIGGTMAQAKIAL
jgi:type II secretion system protein N